MRPKAIWKGHSMRLELTRVGLLVDLANHYTTRGSRKKKHVFVWTCQCFFSWKFPVSQATSYSNICYSFPFSLANIIRHFPSLPNPGHLGDVKECTIVSVKFRITQYTDIHLANFISLFLFHPLSSRGCTAIKNICQLLKPFAKSSKVFSLEL